MLPIILFIFFLETQLSIQWILKIIEHAYFYIKQVPNMLLQILSRELEAEDGSYEEES